MGENGEKWAEPERRTGMVGGRVEWQQIRTCMGGNGV